MAAGSSEHLSTLSKGVIQKSVPSIYHSHLSLSYLVSGGGIMGSCLSRKRQRHRGYRLGSKHLNVQVPTSIRYTNCHSCNVSSSLNTTAYRIIGKSTIIGRSTRCMFLVGVRSKLASLPTSIKTLPQYYQHPPCLTRPLVFRSPLPHFPHTHSLSLTPGLSHTVDIVSSFSPPLPSRSHRNGPRHLRTHCHECC